MHRAAGNIFRIGDVPDRTRIKERGCSLSGESEPKQNEKIGGVFGVLLFPILMLLLGACIVLLVLYVHLFEKAEEEED